MLNAETDGELIAFIRDKYEHYTVDWHDEEKAWMVEVPDGKAGKRLRYRHGCVYASELKKINTI